MRVLRGFLLVFFVVTVVNAAALVFFPRMMAEAGMGPQDLPSARYMAAILLGVATANWYAFRNPLKNVAVVRALISLQGLSILVALYDGFTGAEQWTPAIGSIIFAVVFGGGMAYFYPRGEKAT